MTRPTAIIAEDEPLLRGELKEALLRQWPELDIVSEAEDGVQALHAFRTHQPRVLFLDIEMPGMNGLQVAAEASGKSHIVFVTAYNEYAVAAFEQGALDYVMKPFSGARLSTAIERVKERISGDPADLKEILRLLAERSQPAPRYLRWISVPRGRNVQLITCEEICYFQADNKYTEVVTAAGRWLINKTIRELEQELDPEVFLRVHRGTIVNVGAIAAVERDARGSLEVRLRQREEKLPVSASYAHIFRHM